MTRDVFDDQMRRLGVLRFPPADLESHWSALLDVDEEVFVGAVGHALKTRRDFPVPAELRADADHVSPSIAVLEPPESRDTQLAEPFTITIPEAGKVVSITREWKYYCSHCSDSGWKCWWCGSHESTQRKPWVETARCERRNEHGNHEFVSHCACWDSNPALIRKREAVKKYAESPARVS